ncbi:MAG TPA: STAS domain-containing protein [Rectinemataceae bacterium]|nr:STAS domain-containing protein [Rectinemataceae bacterium]
MEWSYEEHEGRTVVRMTGDCDLYSAPRFKAAVIDKVESGTGRLLIDLSAVRYLDSTGVGALISILQLMKQRGGELRFRGVTGSPKRVLEMSGIISLMKMEVPAGREISATGRTN